VPEDLSESISEAVDEALPRLQPQTAAKDTRLKKVHKEACRGILQRHWEPGKGSSSGRISGFKTSTSGCEIRSRTLQASARETGWL